MHPIVAIFHHIDTMNLLSHYYIDKQNPSADFKLGLVFPDLQRGFNALLKKDLFQAELKNEVERSFVAGIQRHYQVDKVFHNLPYFNTYTDIIKQQIAEHTNIDNRVYFLAHIYLEMLIDKALIETDTLLPVAFYQDMRNVNRTSITELLASIGKQQLATAFFGNFNKFLEARHLVRYADDNSFVRGVLYSFERATGVNTTSYDESGLLKTTHYMLENYRNDLLEVFSTIDEQI